MTAQNTTRRLPTFVIALLPLVLLGLLVAVFIRFDPTQTMTDAFPPAEELTIGRLVLEPGQIIVEVVNGGPDPVTIAQVMVDDAYWSHTVQPAREIAPLGHASVVIPYHWVEQETHFIKLVTSTGMTFEGEIAVAVTTPKPSLSLFVAFAMLGIYVGVIPVALGLMWFGALKHTPQHWLDFFLFLTIGLLVFLGIDAIEEGFKVTEKLPGVYQGVGLLVTGIIGSFMLLTVLGKSTSKSDAPGSPDDPAQPLKLAYLVATGIGLHNLSEGLAIGAAYSLGEISLGAMLVVGFMMHNTTEGLAIVAPIAQTGTKIKHLLWLGAIGGVPTILGTWIGGFTYSPVMALIFLAIGAGAIMQVAWQITMQMAQRRGGREGHGGAVSLINGMNVCGLMAGFLVMYATGLLVAT